MPRNNSTFSIVCKLNNTLSIEEQLIDFSLALRWKLPLIQLSRSYSSSRMNNFKLSFIPSMGTSLKKRHTSDINWLQTECMFLQLSPKFLGHFILTKLVGTYSKSCDVSMYNIFQRKTFLFNLIHNSWYKSMLCVQWSDLYLTV